MDPIEKIKELFLNLIAVWDKVDQDKVEELALKINYIIDGSNIPRLLLQ